MNTQAKQSPVYVLGHEEKELQRLIKQGQFFGELTEQVFVKAGISEGMTVLDLGCGSGDVSFLAAKLVGPTGAVIGIDKSAESLAFARQRADAAEIDNVSFIEGNIDDFPLGQSVDALVGRFVLMYLTDPAAVLRRAARHVRAGGVIAFHEMGLDSGCASWPPSDLHQQCFRWIVETYRAAKLETKMGMKLFQTFIAAGLSAPQMIMDARVEGGSETGAYELIANTVRSLMPMAERLGVAKPEDIEIETLAQRLRDEVTMGGGVIVLPTLFGAWTKK